MSCGASNRFVFSERQLEKLRQDWADGLTAAVMAERIGCSKNAIIGKVHRLNLTSRASPIIEDAWAQDEIATVIRMKVEGRSNRECGEALGVSTHAVDRQVGKLRKAGKLKTVTRQHGVPKERKLKAPKRPVIRVNAVQAVAFGVLTPPREPTLIRTPDETGPEKLAGYHECMWMMNSRAPWRQCCAPREGSRPYCTTHVNIGVVRRLDKQVAA